MKTRLDLWLVRQGLADSREQAKRLVMAGEVRLGDRIAMKPSEVVSEDWTVTVRQPSPFVSRGGEKLDHALRHFEFNVADLDCIDVGASTGGFTDCLLQHGAARVIALDVGRGQLHWSLRQDPRVTVIERYNARFLDLADLPFKPSRAVVDVAFISLRLILPPLARILTSGGDIVTLIKPQFEAGRRDVGKGGVVRDPRVHGAVVDAIRVFGENQCNLTWLGLATSPLTGPNGNVEFLAWWRTAWSNGGDGDATVGFDRKP